jgi:hypothetical protein
VQQRERLAVKEDGLVDLLLSLPLPGLEKIKGVVVIELVK